MASFLGAYNTAFSLSPAVSVKEFNLTNYTPNIPSAKTGMILRADSGPCLEIVPVTSESDLVSKFGKPTAYNYQDWYQCWNFLQYSSSLYVVRPMDANTETKNAGIGIAGSTVSENVNVANMYNSVQAEYTLKNFTQKTDTLYFINKEITSNQRYAIGVCSNPSYFNNPIGLEYFASVNSVSGTTSVTATKSTSLINGSQVILNNNKLATVTAINQSTSANSVIVFDRAISAEDINPYYGICAETVTATANSLGTFNVKFKKDGLTFKVGTTLSDYLVVSAFNNVASDSTLTSVTFTNIGSSASGMTFTKDKAESSKVLKYYAKTNYNPNKGDFGIEAGSDTISVQAGYILDIGVTFSLSGNSNLQIASIDKFNNTIKLVKPVSAAISSADALEISQTVTGDVIIVGVNFFDKIYDGGIINKTLRTVKDVNNNNINIFAQSLVPFNKIFEYPPNWSNDEFNVIVLRKNDAGYYEKFETFLASYNETAKNINGANIYVEDVFFKTAKSVYAKVGDKFGERVNTGNMPLPKIISDTASGSTIYPKTRLYGKQVYNPSGYVTADIIQAENLFADPEVFDVNILIGHDLNINGAATIAETRKDCIAVIAPFDYEYLSTHSNTECTQYLLDNYGSQTEYQNKKFSTFGTYSSFYGNMKYQYDKFNNVNRWINIAGDVAGLYAQTDNTNDPWWAPAGTTRGVIKNAIKLAFNPNKQNRDDLYINSINPVMAIAGEGAAIVWGQKTSTSNPSAFDRVNVRRLLIHLEKSLSTAVNFGLFEFNDVFTRTRITNVIDPFLRSVKARRGLYDYKVVCDESNNTPDIIDQNGLVISVFLQVVKVVEFINLNIIVTPTGVSFTETVSTY